MGLSRIVGVLAAAGALAACPGGGAPPGTTAVRVAAVRDVGVVKNPALGGVVRDGGAAGRVGDKVLWTFGDTFLPFTASDGLTYRSSSAAFADPATPTVLAEPVDESGAPHQLLAFDAEELAYNAQSGAPDERYALRPTAVLPFAENGLIVYARTRIRPGTSEPVSTGMALIRPGSTVAERSPEIFTAPQPQFHDGAALDAGRLVLYACAASGRCRLARAPFADARQRSAYEFWTGAGWSPDVALAAEDVPGSTSGFSVAYDTYLERFVAVYGKPPGGAIVLRTAAHPEGPWSDEIPILDVGVAISSTVQHPELAASAGKILFVSYFAPGAAGGGEIRLLEITFE